MRVFAGYGRDRVGSYCRLSIHNGTDISAFIVDPGSLPHTRPGLSLCSTMTVCTCPGFLTAANAAGLHRLRIIITYVSISRKPRLLYRSLISITVITRK
jgi:hypothetical protein